MSGGIRWTTRSLVDSQFRTSDSKGLRETTRSLDVDFNFRGNVTMNKGACGGGDAGAAPRFSLPAANVLDGQPASCLLFLA